jgi:hypothetical protein
VVNAHNFDCVTCVVDSINDPVGPTSRRHVPGQISEERLADPMWILQQWAKHELHHGRSDLLWQASQVAFG